MRVTASHRPILGILITILLTHAACDRRDEAPATAASATPLDPIASPVQFRDAQFSYAVFLPAEATADQSDLDARLTRLTARGPLSLTVAAARGTTTTVPTTMRDLGTAATARPSVHATVFSTDAYRAPDTAWLGRFGRGLSTAQIDQVAGSTHAWVLAFSAPPSRARGTVRAADELVLRLAREVDGYPWDEETREMFSPDAWEERRTSTWDGEVPDMGRQIAIHVYPPGDGPLLRAVTLGMRKFGRPDLVVNDISRHFAEDHVTLLILACQTLVENESPPVGDILTVDLANLRHGATVERMRKHLVAGATGRADLALATAEPGEGDADNGLVELTFANSPGASPHERHRAVLGTAFGSSDGVTRFRGHSAAVRAASERAKAKLSAKRAAFRRGFDPAEHLLVKAPFDTFGGGREWMWVEVTAWAEEGQITGILSNEPQDVPNLRAGAVVTVNEADVFDYLHRLPDGRTEGNETGNLLRASTSQPAE